MSNEKIAVILLLLVALAALAGVVSVSFDAGKLAFFLSYPFMLGGEISGPPLLGWNMAPWAFGSQCDVASLPLYFNAHGFGFPMTLGNYRISFIPSIY